MTTEYYTLSTLQIAVITSPSTDSILAKNVNLKKISTSRLSFEVLVPVGEADVVTAHTDLRPTILKIAGGKVGWEGLDGSPISLEKEVILEAKEKRQEHVNVEFWGRSIPEGVHKFSLDDGRIVSYGPTNTYKALRLISKNYNLYYSVWCTNEHELYDLNNDPHQTNNIYPSSTLSFPQLEHHILNLPLTHDKRDKVISIQ